MNPLELLPIKTKPAACAILKADVAQLMTFRNRARD